jgi:hypothetical protein
METPNTFIMQVNSFFLPRVYPYLSPYNLRVFLVIYFLGIA